MPIHRTAPWSRADKFYQSSDVKEGQRLRSAASSSGQAVRRTRISTIGDRAFPAVASQLWNNLPLNVTSAPSLTVLPEKPDDSSLQSSPPPIFCSARPSNFVISNSIIILFAYTCMDIIPDITLHDKRLKLSGAARICLNAF